MPNPSSFIQEVQTNHPHGEIMDVTVIPPSVAILKLLSAMAPPWMTVEHRQSHEWKEVYRLTDTHEEYLLHAHFNKKGQITHVHYATFNSKRRAVSASLQSMAADLKGMSFREP